MFLIRAKAAPGVAVYFLRYPIKSGHDEMTVPSRGAISARAMPYNASNIPLSTIASRLNRRWDRLRFDHALRQ